MKKTHNGNLFLLQKSLKTSLIVICLFLYSCSGSTQKQKKNNIKQIEQYLTGGGEKFWTSLKPYPITNYAGIIYKSNGTTVDFIISQKTGQRIIVNPNYNAVWKIKNDSILVLGNGDIECKIEYINDSILILNNLKLKSTYVEYKSKDQKTKPIEDTTMRLFPLLD